MNSITIRQPLLKARQSSTIPDGQNVKSWISDDILASATRIQGRAGLSMSTGLRIGLLKFIAEFEPQTARQLIAAQTTRAMASLSEVAILTRIKKSIGDSVRWMASIFEGATPEEKAAAITDAMEEGERTRQLEVEFAAKADEVLTPDFFKDFEGEAETKTEPV